MKFTLKDYQEQAVAEVLQRLAKARRRWLEEGDRSSISFSATTGAGKTVIAAAVLEALFFGSDQFNVAPDAGAVVLWFSDDPALNAQSQWRLLEASDRLNLSGLVTIDAGFAADRLEAGKVYFLNTQKLSKTSLLVRGHGGGGEDASPSLPMPDARAVTFWDIIRNTIETPGMTLYLVLDEAHRGMGEARGGEAGRATIVRQLINGSGGVPGIPVVLGISATVARFDEAMRLAENRSRLPDVRVDTGKVQESGLLKDTIILDVPDERGDFRSVLVRRAARRLQEMTEAWAAYARAQASSVTVIPLLVLQVPNMPDHDEIGRWLDVICDTMPELAHEVCFANVFGGGSSAGFGRHVVPYIEPQRVQESEHVRVLIAKDAISTGWDCPRAEVMVSFRPAKDHTYITQLLGRMVRAPLARRIPGNDTLNAVDCILPLFDRAMAERVVADLTGGGEATQAPPVRRILIEPQLFTPNPAVPEEVWEKLVSLPAQCPPRCHARPVRRLTLLGHELDFDGIVDGAGGAAHRLLHEVLDGERARLGGDVERARRAVLSVEGQTLRVEVRSGMLSFDDFAERADTEVIEEAYRSAARGFSTDLARSYAEHIAKGLAGGDDVDRLMEAHEIIAALGLVPEIRTRLDAAAEKIAVDWLGDHRRAIDALPDERQEVYRALRSESAHPLDSNLVRPVQWQRETVMRDAGGGERQLPRYERHLLSDAAGLFPLHHASSWEDKVLAHELKDPKLLGWYRNPGTPGPDSLGIAFEQDGEARIMRPDFLVFTRRADGGVDAAIVDPHDHSKADSLARLQGLARYAAIHGAHFARIDAIAEVGGSYRVLDLRFPELRAAVAAAGSAAAAYAAGRAYSL